MKVAFVIAWIMLGTAGCTFQSSQLDTLRALISPSDRGQEYAWIAQLGNAPRGVVVMKQGDLFIFANTEGDAIGFDGWIVRSVVGFGLVEPLVVRAGETDRLYSTKRETAAHPCSPWMRQANNWVQQCKADFSYQNRITLDQQGRIIEIDQVVSADGTRLLLKKQS